MAEREAVEPYVMAMSMTCVVFVEILCAFCPQKD